MKHTLSLFACLLLSLSAFSAGTDTITGTWHGITYTLTLPDSVLTFTGSGRIYQEYRPIVYPWDSIKSKVKHLRIEGTITNVPDEMLDSAANLKTIWMSDNVTTIDSRNEVYFEGAFASCRKLETVRLSPNLKIISWGAFYECSSLREIEIPSSVSTIGMWAFYGCSGMQKITCLCPTPPTVADNSFTKTAIPLYVPSGSIPAYRANYVWKKFNLMPLIVGTTAIAPDSTELTWLPIDHASLYQLHLYTDSTCSVAIDTTLMIYADSLNGGIMLPDGVSAPQRIMRIVLDEIGSVVIIHIDPTSGASPSDPFVVTVSTTSSDEIPIHFDIRVFRSTDLIKEDFGTFILNYDYYQSLGIESLFLNQTTPFCFDLNGRSYPISQWNSLPTGIYILRENGGVVRKIMKR